MKSINPLWNFFASVRLAIFTLSTLAITSIIGTIIPQHESQAFYAKRYSPEMASIFQILDIPDMYSSWWFVGLLAILAANLTICSIDRFPSAWRQITASPAEVPLERIRQMQPGCTWHSSLPITTLVSQLLPLLQTVGTVSKQHDSTHQLLYSQKGAWSRLGVYLVHASILLIFAGAIVGHFWGFKGNVMIPEGEQTDSIFLTQGQTPQPLGFTVRCDSFSIEFYDNGMPKEYLSKLTILENGQQVLSQNIEVNGPLQYKGITFYQSSYQGYKDFVIAIADQQKKIGQSFIIPFQQQEQWPDGNVQFGVVNADVQGERIVRIKLWMKIGDHPPQITQMAPGQQTTVTAGNDSYQVTVRQLYATGLQVAKDPGVWLVYLGCLLLIAGLFVAFFLAHRRWYILLEQSSSEQNSVTVTLSGSSNKNKQGFRQHFTRMQSSIDAALKTAQHLQ